MADARVRELKRKISSLVRQKFNDNYQQAFQHYSNFNGRSGIETEGLKRLLSDAGVGNGFTRGTWADGILGQWDTDRNKTLSWREFEALIERP